MTTIVNLKVDEGSLLSFAVVLLKNEKYSWGLGIKIIQKPFIARNYTLITAYSS